MLAQNSEELILSLRVAELSARDKILHELKKPEFESVWRSAGSRSLREYCEDTLSYGPLETREILIKTGHILTRESMTSEDPETRARIKRLISWRTQAALAERLPAYRILSNRTLLAVANANPTTLEQLEAINGIGHVKVRNFGREILSNSQS